MSNAPCAGARWYGTARPLRGRSDGFAGLASLDLSVCPADHRCHRTLASVRTRPTLVIGSSPVRADHLYLFDPLAQIFARHIRHRQHRAHITGIAQLAQERQASRKSLSAINRSLTWLIASRENLSPQSFSRFPQDPVRLLAPRNPICIGLGNHHDYQSDPSEPYIFSRR